MLLSDCYSFIIPGYELLSEDIKKDFESSSSGILIVELAQEILFSFKELEATYSFWGVFNGRNKERADYLHEQVKKNKEDLIQSIKDSEEYKEVISVITRKIISQEIKELLFLPPEHQELFSRTHFAQHLYLILTESKDPLGINKKNVECLKEREKKILVWKKEFMESPEYDFYRTEIKLKQRALLDKRTQEWSIFFPLLNYRFEHEESFIKQLRDKYFEANGELLEHPEAADKDKLTDLLFRCMQEVAHIEINYMELDQFNKEHAQQMAQTILDAFKNKIKIDLDNCFRQYEIDLGKYILAQINNARWQQKDSNLMTDGLNSLSFLWKNKTVDNVSRVLDKIADAHGFIQVTGFATQNENSFLAYIDLYNYYRYFDNINKTRSFFISLLSPFFPLFEEYKDIAFFEKNNFWKLYRIVMPIIVTVFFISLVAVVLFPLFLPDLAFLAVFIPSFIIGLGLASGYVATKNSMYNSFRELFYGGPFEIPEFQINERLITAFGSKANAHLVREFYIEELSACDKLEQKLNLKHKTGVLNQEELEQRKANREKRRQLCLEWFDIHSNKELSYMEAPKIFSNRMQQASSQKYQELQKTIKEDCCEIQNSVRELTRDIKKTVENNNKMSIAEDDIVVKDPLITVHCRHRLFNKPHSLIPKAHLEYLEVLREQVVSSNLN